MKDWVKRIVTSIVFFGLIGAAVVVLTAADDPKVAFLPGVTVPDEHPNGCIDCHKNNGPDQDYRLNVSLSEIGHVDITKIVKTIPKDCSMCHKPDTEAGPLLLKTHLAHYQSPDENHFISFYQGACLNCHSLNLDTGGMGVKNGPKNW